MSNCCCDSSSFEMSTQNESENIIRGHIENIAVVAETVSLKLKTQLPDSRRTHIQEKRKRDETSKGERTTKRK